MSASKKFLVYAQRPDGSSLWLPSPLAQSLGLIKVSGANVAYPSGKKLSAAQFGDSRVQDLIGRRFEAKGEAIFE